MGLGFAGMTEYGFKGQKGDRGESFHVDKFGPLDDAQVRSIESSSAVDENDVYVFVVTSDTRTAAHSKNYPLSQLEQLPILLR